MDPRLKVIARDNNGRAKRVELTQDAGIAIGDVKLTPEGYMVTENVPVARTGIQEYSALELGLDASMKTIRLLRPPEEVFAPASMATLDRKPITYYHPERGGVDSSNWMAVAVGHVETPAQDGDFLDVGRFEVNDGQTVQSIAFGVKEVSCGYSFDLDMTPGTTADGQSYDGVMRSIVHNHVAIVYQGRCGAGCAIGDCACSATQKSTATTSTHQGDSPMATRTLMIGKINITLDEKDAAIIEEQLSSVGKRATDTESALAVATKRAADAETALLAQGDAMKKLATDHAAVVAELQGKIQTPEQRKAEVAEIVRVTADAKLVAPDFAVDGKSATEIRIGVLDHVISKDAARKPVVVAMLGGCAPEKADGAIVRGAFDAVVALRGTGVGTSDSHSEAARAFAPGWAARGGHGNARVIDYNARQVVGGKKQASA